MEGSIQNAMRSAIDRPAPAPATPGAHLLQGAFRSALQDTSLDFMTLIDHIHRHSVEHFNVGPRAGGYGRRR